MKNIRFATLLILCDLLARSGSITTGELLSHSVFDSVGNATVGQKTLPKAKPGHTAVQVFVGVYFESLGAFEATSMSFDVDVYLYLSWLDSRLSHSLNTTLTINDHEILQRMWLPDIYFANAKKANFQSVTVPNFAMHIDSDGTVAYSTRVTMNVACSLDLRDYPMDEQVCSIRMLSYAHTVETMVVKWFSGESALRLNKHIDLPEMRVVNFTPKMCDGRYRYAIMENRHREGIFSCLSAELNLERSIGYHLVQTYIPTGLIVIISWVSFWIDRNAVPARVSLSFTTLLTLSTMGAGLRYALPPVSYAKAIDYWFGVCMLFVFAALLEFALVNSYTRRSKKVAIRLQKDVDQSVHKLLNDQTNGSRIAEDGIIFDGTQLCSENSLYQNVNKISPGSLKRRHRACSTLANRIGDDECDNEDGTEKTSNDMFGVRMLNADRREVGRLSRIAYRIDMYSRFMFPLVFFIFNITYWYIYAWHRYVDHMLQ